MTQDDHSIIQVGEDRIGIRGLKSAIQELAESHRDKNDEEIGRDLMDMLRQKNYIANSAKDEYCEAFVREFRKHLGQPHDDAGVRYLTIEVLGPGCSQCDQLERLVKQVLSELKLAVSVEHVAEIKEFAKYGFVSTPALVINGNIVSRGIVPSAKKIKEWLNSVNK
jgi:small redox-active disulfide protein 2